MTKKYEELVQRLSQYKKLAQEFEVNAVNKVLELGTALTNALGAPENVVQSIDQKPVKELDQQQAGHGTVLGEDGLHYAIRVSLRSRWFQWDQRIAPDGDRLIATVDKNKTIDVTDAAGVAQWVEWAMQEIETSLGETTPGRIAKLLKKF